MVDQTLQCIRQSMIELLEKKEYSKIQMKEIAENAHVGRKTLYRYFDSKEQITEFIATSLMDRFAKEITGQGELTLTHVTYAFYHFIKNNKTEFMILKKARMISYIEDHLVELIIRISATTKYEGMSSQEIKQQLNAWPAKDRYAFYYMIAGYWRMAVTWMEEDSELTPEQMTEITMEILSGLK